MRVQTRDELLCGFTIVAAVTILFRQQLSMPTSKKVPLIDLAEGDDDDDDDESSDGKSPRLFNIPHTM